MAAGKAARRAERAPLVESVVGASQVSAALDLLELTEYAWHDCCGEITPPDEVILNILVCSEGDLATMVHAAHLAVTDWRDLQMWADRVQGSGARPPGGSTLSHPVAGEGRDPGGQGGTAGPQLEVESAGNAGRGLLAVTGRCLAGPVTVGTVFDGIAPARGSGGPRPGPTACSLRVSEIYLFEQPVDAVGPPHATRLVLAGDWPADLTRGAVLVVRHLTVEH